MKKITSVFLILVLALCMYGCRAKNNFNYKLSGVERFSSMTIDGTTSIEVVYTYIDEERTVYEFVIEDKETIDKIMTELFNMELKDAPDARIDYYFRMITVNQGDNEYSINLAKISHENGYSYVCQSQNVRSIIEKYIENNLVNVD